MKLFLVVANIMVLSWMLISCSSEDHTASMQEADYTYSKIQEKLAKGWNTWNTNNVLSHVLLPEDLSINLILKDNKTGQYLKSALLGHNDEHIQLLAHSSDGSYTELTLKWNENAIRVQSATTREGEDQVVLVTPLDSMTNHGSLIIDAEILWGHEGMVTNSYDFIKTAGKDTVYAYFPTHRIDIYTRGIHVNDPYCIQKGCAQAMNLNAPVTVSTGKNRSKEEIFRIIDQAKENLARTIRASEGQKDVYDLVQTVLNWNVIYDPSNRRVISPVSRIWSSGWRGGYVLFGWDNYFAAYMFSVVSKELAYANLIETTKIVDKVGFVPNHNAGNDITFDHSEPPVGSLMTKAVYLKFKDKWLLNEVFDRLLKWNLWWSTSRDQDGYLCWGSDPYPGMEKSFYNTTGIQRAKWESGLDNSPMYDHVPFDSIHTHMMALADVGLMSIYVADCNALAFIASEIGRTKEKKELLERGEKYKQKLNTLWDEKSGIYLNKRLDNGEFSHHISPTNFYPLLAKAPTKEQAERMIREHFYNPDEFWGNYIMPSIARNDSAFRDNNYWRGRIWAPMNFLVYLGLLNYDFPQARTDLVRKSKDLLLKDWISRHYIFENYNAITGQGDDVNNSDNFYLWGGLLGFMQLMENKVATAP